MIFIAKNADFSAKNIGTVDVVYQETEEEGGGGSSTTSKKVTSIGITNPISTIKIGQTHQFVAQVYPLDADNTTLAWSCNPTSVGSITADGTFTAITQGTVAVIAKATDGSGIRETLTIAVEAKTAEDVSELAKAKMAYYDKDYSDAEAIAVDDFLTEIGAGESDSIYSKLKVLLMPCMSTSVDNAFKNFIDGVNNMTTASAAQSDLSVFTLSNGRIIGSGTGNNNVPMNANGVINNNLSYVLGGNPYFSGGSTSFTLTTTSESACLMLTSPNSAYKIGARFNAGNLRGMSLNQELGFDATVVEPSNQITESYGSQEIMDAYYVKYPNFKGSGYIQIKNEKVLYCFACGTYLTEQEMKTLLASLNKLFAVFGVDQGV